MSIEWGKGTLVTIELRLKATKAGTSREAVGYWERKAVVDLRGWAVVRFLDALGLGAKDP